MDITKLFKASLNAVRAKKKLTKRILPEKKHKKKGFHHSAIDVVKTISKLRDFLIKHQVEYVGEYSHLLNISAGLSTEERDKIDADTQSFIQSCMAAIENMQKQAKEIVGGENFKSHVTSVVEILKSYLEEVCKLYAKQKAIRLKQVIVRDRLSRLQPEVNIKEKETKLSKPLEKLDEITDKKDQQNQSNTEDKISKRNTIIQTSEKESQSNSTADNQLHIDEYKKEDQPNIQLSAEEAQMFEEENLNLFSELDSKDKEIKNIESKVVSISELQQTFREKVLSQATQIENIYNTAVSTTENVKEGNEQIREAIKNSATFRVWILFFLVMCTFSLLFLDWYNL